MYIFFTIRFTTTLGRLGSRALYKAYKELRAANFVNKKFVCRAKWGKNPSKRKTFPFRRQKFYFISGATGFLKIKFLSRTYPRTRDPKNSPPSGKTFSFGLSHPGTDTIAALSLIE